MKQADLGSMSQGLWLRTIAAWAMVWVAMSLSLVTVVHAAEAPEGAQQVVTRLETALINAMKQGDAWNYAARRRELAPVVDLVLDIERMGRFIFGSQWNDFSDTDRKAFVQAFRNLSTSTYAARFKRYQDETFEHQAGDAQGDRRARVRSHFTKKSGDVVVFDYLLVRGAEDAWRIVNIIVDGVSDLALKRTQYSGIFSDLGMSGVIETMASQEQQLQNE